MSFQGVSKLAALAVTGLLVACTHPVEIVGEGNVLSASGKRDCLKDDAPCEFVIANAYDETYLPQGINGHSFVGWEGCLIEGANDSCSFLVPEESVRKWWFKTAPPLVAVFAAACEGAPANTYDAIQEEIFEGAGCSINACHGTLAQGGVQLNNANTYAQLFDQATEVIPSLKRIEPGDAENSYLYLSVLAGLTEAQADLDRIAPGKAMPNIGDALTQAQVDAIRAWIDAGAPSTGTAPASYEVEQLLGLCGG